MATAADASYPFSGQTLGNTDWQRYLTTARNDGVVPGALNIMAVSQRAAGANMSVDMASGRVIIQGIFAEFGSTKNVVISTADATNPRIDVIVVRLNNTDGRIELDVLTGTPAGSPSAPALTQNTTTWEVALAQVAVGAGAASIVNANITDRRPWGSYGGASRAASLASATSLPLYPTTGAINHLVIPVTGTTTINEIPLATAGTVITLDFASAGCSVSAGVSLVMPRAFLSSARGTLTFVSDGTIWAEVARTGDKWDANLVLSGPASGASAVSTYRSLVKADLPIVPACRARRTTDQAIADVTTTIMAFDAELFDTDTIHDNVTNNSRLTCRTAGVYIISATVQWEVDAVGLRGIYILHNGATVIADNQTLAVTDAATSTNQTISAIYSLAVNDYVELQVRQASGGSLDVQTAGNYSPEFMMAWVGRAS